MKTLSVEFRSKMTPMEEAFHKHPYSWSFNTLIFFGKWGIHTKNKRKKLAYEIYRIIMILYGVSLGALGVIDLYQSKESFTKSAYNLCATTLSCGIAIKNFHLLRHSKQLDSLRLRLFADSWTQTDPEEEKIKEHFIKIWLQHRKVFYLAEITIIPIWWMSSLRSLFTGPRELPFPIYFPLNLDDNFQYFCGFVYHMIGSAYVSNEVVQADLAMYSLILQISTQYCILTRNIMSINLLYSEDPKDSKEKESNVVLANRKTKQKLRECIKKQLTLWSYTKELEYCYNPPMLLQFFCAGLLAVGNGVELIVMQVSRSFSAKLMYQLLYSMIALGDIFMVCTLCELLKEQFEKLEQSLYNVAWYKMDKSCRKDLYFMTMGAQKHFCLTAGKMFYLDRPTFRGLAKNVYSWLALCRQVIIKK